MSSFPIDSSTELDELSCLACASSWTRRLLSFIVDGMDTPTAITTPAETSPSTPGPEPDRVVAQLRRRSFATLATTSPAGVPHVAGVLYEIVGDRLYVNTLRTSRKARNVDVGGRVAICVPIRRLPVGPPSSVQFQAVARVVPTDAPEIRAALDAGGLRSLTKHGELELLDGCFIEVELPRRLLTYGLGMSLPSLIADPLAGAGSVHVETW